MNIYKLNNIKFYFNFNNEDEDVDDLIFADEEWHKSER